MTATTVEVTPLALAATVHPYPVTPEVRIRPDIVKLGQLPPYVEDPGPASFVRLDDTTPAALEHLLREWQVAPHAIRALDSGIETKRCWAIADAAATQLLAEGDPRLRRLPGGDLGFPFLGIELGAAGTLSSGPPAPTTPAALAALAPLAQALIAGMPAASRVLDALRATLAEDLVVLLREARGDGRRAGYLCVAAPSGWDPGARAGASFADLHRPVPHHAPLLTAAAQLVDAMVERGPFVRYVWSLSASAALSHHPNRYPAAPLGSEVARWWLRVERQTTLPVPVAGAALFAIRVLHQPLVEALTTSERRQRLAAAVTAMDAPMLSYKRLTQQRPTLLRYLASAAINRPN